MSRAIISEKRLSQLQGKDACNTSAQSEIVSTPADHDQNVGEKLKFGEIRQLLTKLILNFISYVRNNK